MAKRKNKNKSIITLIVSLIVIISALFGGKEISDDLNVKLNKNLDGNIHIHFIDVGQGSCTLISEDREGILIDSGLSEYGEKVTDYLISLGIEKLSFVIATHPHSDHIGSLKEVMENFEVGTVIMPELAKFNTPTTKIYESFIDYIIEKDIPVYAAEYGDKYEMKDVSFKILGPVEQNKDLNNMSVIVRFQLGEESLMVLGDAEKEELRSVYEYNLENENYSLKSDILLMGHHGSGTSVYEPFLNDVKARYACISCGVNNSYGHPHRKALDYLKSSNIEYYRTDTDGTISFVIIKDGLKVN